MSPSCRGVRGTLSRPRLGPCVGAGAPGFWGACDREEATGGVGRGGAVRRGRVRPLSPPAPGRGRLALAGLPASSLQDRAALRASAAPPAASAGRGLGLRPVPLSTGAWPGCCPQGPAGSGASGRPLRACPPPAVPGRPLPAGSRCLGPALDEEAAEAPAGAAGLAVSAPRRGRAAGEAGGRKPGEPSSGEEARPGCRRLPPACRPRSSRWPFLTSLSKRLSILLFPGPLNGFSHRSPLCRGPCRPPPACSTSSRVLPRPFLPAASLSPHVASRHLFYFLLSRVRAHADRHTHTLPRKDEKLPSSFSSRFCQEITVLMALRGVDKAVQA